MRVVLLGPPGAGKGTQAEKLEEKLGIPQISTGELFRQNISDGTELGLEARRYLDAGDLVPSDVTNKLVEDRISQRDAATGFKFAPVTTDSLASAVRRAHAAFGDKQAWRSIQTNGMSTDVSWRNRASRYADLYREIITTRSG